MPVTVQSVYNQVCLIMMEDYGFDQGTGIFTDSEFQTALLDIIQDFQDRTGYVKKIINIHVNAGVGIYDEPNTSATVQSVNLNNEFIYRDSGAYLDNFDPGWTLTSGRGFKWKEDENPPQTIRIAPTPSVDGYEVQAGTPQLGYGVISSTTNPQDFNITAAVAAQGYGTISSADTGAVYLETLDPGYGTISTMISSTGNIQLLSAVIALDLPKLNDYLYLVPESFALYLSYGVLWKLFSADSEAKDMNRAMYASARYREGLNAAASIMTEAVLDSER